MKDVSMGFVIPLLLLATVLCQVYAVSRPPGIYQQPPNDVFYKADETVQLHCRADGDPKPAYTWKRNGRDFHPSGNDYRVVQLEDEGTLVFTKPEDKDEGIFQCNATNQWGTSLSINANLRQAKLKKFVVGDATTMRPRLGDNMTLPCVPPESVPPAHVFWVVIEPGRRFVPVNYDARVSMDIEYRLRFTNVIASDAMGGKAYACMAVNPIMRNATQGPLFYVQPQLGTNNMNPVVYMWASPQDHSGMRGDNFTVKCIFGGNPTPDVHWERTDGHPMPDRARIQSFGQELMIENLQFDDAGIYECWAINTITTSRVLRTVTIRVESRPYWLREPQDVEVGVGGEAEFNCLARSEPSPEYHWFINGIPITKVQDHRITPDRFKRPRPDRIVFTGLTRADSMVLQCNATNKHGSIWGDVYLNVLDEAPTILRPPPMRSVVAEGASIVISCEVTGKPTPTITWSKDDQQITGGRYRTLLRGDLSIMSVVLADAGVYQCKAKNNINSTSASGLLLVRRKTLIEKFPLDLEVTVGYDAKFTCSGTTDPEEVGHLRIEWLKDHNPIVPSVMQRMTTNRQDNSLTISGAIVRDSGTYTCVATNGLDNSSASAMLTVRSKPDAVSKVQIMDCQGGMATVEWMPGSYNNAPIQYYVVQYNTSFSPDTWTFAEKVDSMLATANITLSPWANYTFRVIAYNKIGQSVPSFPSPTVCFTNPDFPDTNPQNLRTVGDMKNWLHIEWTPMPKMQQNGDGFRYVLTLYKEGYEDQVTKIHFDDWRVSEYTHPAGSDVYMPYIITLQAQNSVGHAREDPANLRGFTGEDIPQIGVQNLDVADIGDTYAVLSWDMDSSQIDSIPTAINGYFTGFLIQLWRTNDKSGTLRQWKVSREEALASLVGDRFSGRVGDLLANSDLTATVAVTNTFYVSGPSDSKDFTTLPGLPGPVELFRVINIGDNHANLEWKPPSEHRGQIVGYDIGYQTVKGLDLGEVQLRDPQITDPYAITAMVSGLLTKTRYRIHIWARTVKGRGEGYFIEVTTTKAGDPQAPRFSITEVGQHHINVSWWINRYAISGTIVFVEYRKEEAAEWMRTTDEVLSAWADLADLEAGTTYEIRLVATNGGTKSVSSVEEVTTDGIALASALVGNWGWFLGMMLALFTIIGLVIFFIIVFKRGHRFPQRSHSTPPDSMYDGDTAKYSDTANIPSKSSDFGPEPRGYRNYYYDDRDIEFDHGRDRNSHDDDKNYDEEYRRREQKYQESQPYPDDRKSFDETDNGYKHDDQHHYDQDWRHNESRDSERWDDDRRQTYDQRDSDYSDRRYDYGPPSYADLEESKTRRSGLRASKEDPYEEYDDSDRAATSYRDSDRAATSYRDSDRAATSYRESDRAATSYDTDRAATSSGDRNRAATSYNDRASTSYDRASTSYDTDHDAISYDDNLQGRGGRDKKKGGRSREEGAGGTRYPKAQTSRSAQV